METASSFSFLNGFLCFVFYKEKILGKCFGLGRFFILVSFLQI